jgi:hypothetical protein
LRITFRATEAEFDGDDYSLICGVSGADNIGEEHALSFDRLAEVAAEESPDEDNGIHVQFDQQGYGGYNCIQRCCLSRTRLMLDLSKQLGQLRFVTGFDVELSVADADFATFSDGMRRVFRNKSEFQTV